MHGLYLTILAVAVLLSIVKGHELIHDKALAEPNVEHKSPSRLTVNLPTEPRPALKNGRLNFRLLPPVAVPGHLTIELENASEDHLGLVQFTISVFGQSGELRFEDLAAGLASAKQYLD